MPLVLILGQGQFVPAGLCKDQALNSFANTLRFGCYPRQLRDYVNVGGRTENFRISMGKGEYPFVQVPGIMLGK